MTLFLHLCAMAVFVYALLHRDEISTEGMLILLLVYIAIAMIAHTSYRHEKGPQA